MTRDVLVRLFARGVVGLRWAFVPAWVAAAPASALFLPGLGSGESPSRSEDSSPATPSRVRGPGNGR
ncbi:MAG TPA: hypothetical protein VN960_05535 [Gaiellaceae bacterium]|jgi:hypothetical protein|nr:hypothetical protein [Gaiellaceae bacterium]